MATGSLISEQMFKQLEALQREPFQRVAVRLLRGKPSIKAIKAQAEKSPDRWMQALTQAAKLSGYTEKSEIEVTGLMGVVAELGKLSDAELERRALEARTSRALPAPEAQQAKPEA